jgi:hypothetical protein
MSQTPETRPRIPNIYRPVILDEPFEDFIKQGEEIITPGRNGLCVDILTSREIRALIKLGDTAIKKVGRSIVAHRPDTFDDSLLVPTTEVKAFTIKPANRRYVSVGIEHEVLDQERTKIIDAIQEELGRTAPDFSKHTWEIIAGERIKGTGLIRGTIEEHFEPYLPEGVMLGQGVID